MSWKWTRRSVALGVIAVFAVGAVAADDEKKDAKSPLAKMMMEIDKGSKTIRDATKSRANFKKAKNGKDLAVIAADLAKLGPKMRAIKGPSEKMKKPFAKWTELADIYTNALDDLAKASEKGDFVATQKAWTPLYNSCSNCHGAFRPEVGDDF